MCGIAGQFLTARKAELSHIRQMCDQIRHRGPDDDGYHLDGGCGIGMRRLSIIDLSTGHQPIANEDNSIWIVFNGEIYSYQDLRRDLIARGHRFTSNSDTETIIHLYEEYGVDAFAKLRGMFALALWDSRDRSLVLARDRFGKKPLYYSILPEGLFFGSELKCLIQAGVPRDIDAQALQLYLQFSYIPDPWSPYRAVRKLPAAGWLRYHESGKVEQGSYWKLPAPADHPPANWTEDQAAAEVRRVFDEAVRLRMIADVPLGAFLSGGIDSSSVVASMALQSTEPVKTFSIGFEEATFNELPYARMLADKYKTDHHQILVKPDSLDLIQRMVKHFDEPFGDESCFPTYIVSQFAAEHVKVVLTGDGGDELFAGYESFFAIGKMRWADAIPQFARAPLAQLAERLPYAAYGKNFLWALSRRSALERYFEMNSAPYFMRRQLLEPEWMFPADSAFLTQTLAHCLLPPDASLLSQALYFEATAKLTGNMLVKVDRMSMANSLEVRCPLLDHELAEVAARIPHAWKLKNGAGKQILLRALGDRLPPELINRKKMGFGFPLKIWFRGELRDFVRDHLTSREFLARHIVSEPCLRGLLDEHQSGRRDNSHWIFMLLMLEFWFRENTRLDSQPVTELAEWQVR